MKTTTVLILSFLSLNLYGQDKSRFIFFDACTNEIIELDYELWYYDTLINVLKGQTINLEPNYYQLSTRIERQEMSASFFLTL